MVTTLPTAFFAMRNGRPAPSWRSTSAISSRMSWWCCRCCSTSVRRILQHAGDADRVTGAANLRRPDGSIPNATAAFSTDATATIVGPLLAPPS